MNFSKSTKRKLGRFAALWMGCGLAWMQAQTVAQTVAVGPYAVEEIPMPKGVAPEIGGLDFTPGGKLVVVTRRSGILRARPVKDASQFAWEVFSDQSLHNANGVLVLDENRMLVSQMPELTQVSDTDGDGVADEYRNLASFNLSGAYHEVTAGPVSDGKGGYFIAMNTASYSGFTFVHTRGEFSAVGRRGRNFSSVPYRGWILHLDAAGRVEPWAKGFRSPNGIGTDAEGNLWVTDNQGDFRSTNPLYHVEKGGFYGHPSSMVWDPEFVKSDAKRDPLKEPMEALDAARVPEAVAFPTGSRVRRRSRWWIRRRGASVRLRADAGGRCGGTADHPCDGGEGERDVAGGVRRFLFRERAAQRVQSAGVFTGRHGAVCGTDDAGVGGCDGGVAAHCVSRGRVFEVLRMHLVADGFELEFTEPVDAGAGDAPQAFGTEVYGYKYSSSYGSPEEGTQRVMPTAVQWSADRRSVHLVYAGMQAHRVYRVTFQGVASGGQALGHTMVAYTLNTLAR